MLSFRQLQVIHAVCRSGTVSGAAETLGVSQPAISMALRECGRVAGFPVFERRHGRLHPTAETSELLAEMDRVFNGMERIHRLIDDLRQTTAGAVQVAATPTLADNLLPAAVARFQRTRPRVLISIRATDNLTVVDEVAREQVDLGLALSPVAPGEVRAIELCTAELVCVVHRSSPLAAASSVHVRDLADHPLISFRRSLPLGAAVEAAFRDAGIAQRIALEVNQSSVACALARAGAGVAIIDPFWLLGDREQQLARLRLRPRTWVSAQALVPKGKNLSRPARLFLSALREEAEALRAAPGLAAG